MSDCTFPSKIVTGRKKRICFGCNSKIEIGEKQKVLTGVREGEFFETRLCLGCGYIFDKHYDSISDGGEYYESCVSELMSECNVDNHKDLIKTLEDKF